MTLVNDSQNKNGLISVSFNQDQSKIEKKRGREQKQLKHCCSERYGEVEQ